MGAVRGKGQLMRRILAHTRLHERHQAPVGSIGVGRNGRLLLRGECLGVVDNQLQTAPLMCDTTGGVI